jgi:ABC-type polysaccharide/polyol phosphate export permease
MYCVIECFRTPIYTGQLPEPLTVIWAIVYALVVFIIGISFFTKLSDKFIYYI